MNGPLIEVSALSVRVGGAELVREVSFAVRAKETLGLFGESGSGKTTILHAIAGLLDERYRVRGKLTLAGVDIADLTPDARSRAGLSIVLQELGLFEDRSVFENIAYPLRRRGAAPKAITSAVEEMLALFRLTTLIRRKPHEISGGQRQRVALARALVYDPRLLLLDEPFRGLQEELRLQYLAYLKTVSERGVAIVLVTHDRTELELVADQVVRLADGSIESTERRGTDARIDLLASTIDIADPRASEKRIRVGALKLVTTAGTGVETFNADITQWRSLADGRIAALAALAGDEPAWLVFDPKNAPVEAMRVGSVTVQFERKGV